MSGTNGGLRSFSDHDVKLGDRWQNRITDAGEEWSDLKLSHDGTNGDPEELQAST